MKKLLISSITLLAVALGGCSADAKDDAPTTVAVVDPWIKASDEGMTALFGTIVNESASEVAVVSASSDAAARVELHETVGTSGAMSMREKDGGFVVPAHGSVALEPGRDHLMLIGLTRVLSPGDEVTIHLVTGRGDTIEVVAVVKEFAGAREDYDAHAGDES